MEQLKNILEPMIKNKLINSQHDNIFSNFEILKKSIQTHINSEEKLLEIRNIVKPEGHIDTTDQLNIHYQKHKEFLEKVNELEKELNNHIKLYDYIHLHRL